MAVKLNHLIVPAKDKVASAQLFAEIFGLEVKPSQGRFAQVPIDEYAFHVTDEEFDGVFERVKAKGLTYGSGPTTDTDGRIGDRRGGRALYFRELNGHLLEVMTA
jgi:hypothetical protein